MPRQWKCLAVWAGVPDVDSITSHLFLYGCRGIQEKTCAGNVVHLEAFFDEAADTGALANVLKKKYGCSTTLSVLPDTDWEHEWRKQIVPIRLTKTVWVKPSWSDFTVKAPQETMVVDPKMTFGTGHHETTRICASLLEHVGVAGKTVLDVGTGTGILAILASRLGASRVLAFDVDPLVAENASENFLRNSVANVQLFVGPIQAIVGRVTFDVIAANMIKSEIFSVLDAIVSHLAINSHFVFSGLLREEKKESIRAFAEYGLELVQEKTEGEWYGGICVKTCKPALPAQA